MARTDMHLAARRVVKAVTECGMLDAIRQLRVQSFSSYADYEPIFANLIARYARYHVSYMQFGDDELRIVHALQLEDMVSATMWGQLFDRAGVNPAMTQRLTALTNRIAFTQLYLPRLLDLLEESDELEIGLLTHLPMQGSVSGIWVLLETQHARRNSAFKLSRLIDSAAELYQSCASIVGLPGSSLEVGTTTNGTTQVFHFVGDDRAIALLLRQLDESWSLLRQHAAMDPVRRLQQLDASLPIVDMLSGSNLGDQQMDQLRKRTLRSVQSFFATGAKLAHWMEEEREQVEQAVTIQEKDDIPLLTDYVAAQISQPPSNNDNESLRQRLQKKAHAQSRQDNPLSESIHENLLKELKRKPSSRAVRRKNRRP